VDTRTVSGYVGTSYHEEDREFTSCISEQEKQAYLNISGKLFRLTQLYLSHEHNYQVIPLFIPVGESITTLTWIFHFLILSFA
jgi:hypothetical protein